MFSEGIVKFDWWKIMKQVCGEIFEKFKIHSHDTLK
ncbi:hypothetical protein SS7213T_01676 [Staphylococcus simiae CCM 7213 = CCUG 51256]|uniref:Uncharacterized protein n=1 Tax=Staphylococcus simiae CCM 7213 = CCUG 51256 TaxID=911238 RepID=G5JFX1_9STAP|nr:hypothetical protein SS7213T_01676 [Staphylococcus simiae CCM 7213 = CCUG 51256]